MNRASPFRRLEESADHVGITVDGRPLSVPADESLAAALLAAGHRVTRRTRVSGAPRGPFCMMGTCYECQVSIDGVTAQACMTTVREGMAVETIQSPEVRGDGA